MATGRQGHSEGLRAADPCLKGRPGVDSVAPAARWLRPRLYHHPARVRRPVGGNVPGVRSAVAGEEEDVVEGAEVPARKVHRLERHALTAVARPRAEGGVLREQGAAVAGLQVELEVLVPQIA